MSAGSEVTFRINGESHRAPAGTRLTDVLAELGLDVRRVALERNREVVPRDRHADVIVGEGDAFEVVHFVGGG